MAKLRIGFVGVGAMGQCAHLDNYAHLPECEVTAIAEIREGLGKKVAARYGIPTVYASHTDMLANEQLDAVIASQPFERHGQLIPELYATGLPLFTEKPIARSFPIGEQIVEALRTHKARHAVGYHKRSDLATMYARRTMDEWIASGELGPLRYVRILMPEGDWMASGFSRLIESDDALQPLDEDPRPADMDAETHEKFWMFVNYYIHQVNLMRHLFGESYDVEYVDRSGVLMVVRSKSGVTGSLEMTPFKTTVDWHERALIAFEHGRIELELPAPLAYNRPGRVTVHRDPGDGATPESVTPELPWVHAMKQQAIHFLKYVQGEKTPLCEAEEALDDLRIAHDYIRRLCDS